MEFDHLKGFYYVAKLGSFTEAAGHLYVTQPAISLQVKALEKEIGEKLFDRIGRKIRLTHAGSLLYAQVAELIGRLDDIQRTVGELQKLDRGRLHLGASDTTSMYFLPGLLKEFAREYPGVDLCITSLMSDQINQRVSDRELDLGLVTLSPCSLPLETIPLFQQRLVLITDTEHGLAARKHVNLSDLSGESFIALEGQSVTRTRIDEHFHQARCGVSVVLELSNFEIIKEYVKAGLGISLVPEVAVKKARSELAVVSLKQPLSVGVGITYRKDRELSKSSRAFLDMARDHFRRPDRARKQVLVSEAN
jgi:DNA-binding transcriptional LysR family regulator